MTEIKLMVGCTWDPSQLDLIAVLNEQYNSKNIKITEMYGSLRADYIKLPSARPDYRLPDINIKEFELYIKKASDKNISINYSCNGTFAGTVQDMARNEKQLARLFKSLEDIGVSRLTLAHPLLIEIANASCRLPIEISTILHSSTLANLSVYRNWRVDKVCLNLYLNRDFSFLRVYNKMARKYGISVSLIANEFCMFGSSPCHGILRQACYDQSSNGGNSSKHFSNWPFSRCHAARKENPSSWLKAGFILPQHLRKYLELTSIANFKITGRTNTLEHVLFLMQAYMSENYQGGLSSLWIDQGNQNKKQLEEEINIKVPELERIGFFNRWFDKKPEDCRYTCNVDCNWCDVKYSELNRTASISNSRRNQ